MTVFGKTPAFAAAGNWLRLGLLMFALGLAACTRNSPAPVIYGGKSAAARPGGPIDGKIYRVRDGDTLYAISRRSGVALRDLIEVNDLRPPFVLRPGARLRVPRVRYHRVAAKETLYAISRKYGVSLNRLVQTNGLAAPYTIQVGQRLRLPGRQVAPAQTAAAGSAAPKPPAAKTRVRPPGPAAKPSRRARRRVPPPPKRSGRLFSWPAKGPILSTFGGKPGGLHNDGINISLPRGTPVRAADNGVVAYAGNELRGFGNLILLRHRGGWVTAYAHTEQVSVEVGQTVSRGQILARAGASGGVKRTQLHFEIRRGRRALNPLKYLSGA